MRHISKGTCNQLKSPKASLVCGMKGAFVSSCWGPVIPPYIRTRPNQHFKALELDPIVLGYAVNSN